MLGQPYHYRDARTNGMMEKAFKKVPRSEIFAQTGLQFMRAQLPLPVAGAESGSSRRARSGGLPADDARLRSLGVVRLAHGGIHHRFHLAIPEPGHAQLGVRVLKKFGLPAPFSPKMVMPGTTLGALRPSVAGPAGLGKVQVIAPPEHDTASAVAGVPRPAPARRTGLTSVPAPGR